MVFQNQGIKYFKCGEPNISYSVQMDYRAREIFCEAQISVIEFSIVEPSHEIMALFVIRKLILQSCMCSHPVGLDVLIFNRTLRLRMLCVRIEKALARLRGCAGSPEPSLLAYVTSTIIS